MLNLMLGNSISLFGTFPDHFQYDIYRLQGRSQDLNQPLQNIVQNFDDDVIIMTLTSLL